MIGKILYILLIILGEISFIFVICALKLSSYISIYHEK